MGKIQRGQHLSPSTQFQKGTIPWNKNKKLGSPWNKGLKTSPEVKAKISRSKTGSTTSRKGTKMPEAWKEKLRGARPHTAGENSHLWRGGKGTERHRVMLSIEYQSWRDAVFRRDNYTCQVCDQYNGMLHADHIKSWSEFPGLRYELLNGRTLCRACHYYVTFKRKMPTTSNWGLVGLARKRG